MTVTERAERIHKLRSELNALEIEQYAAVPLFSEWLRARVGKKWVIGARTASIVRRYGEDVVCLSPAGYDKLKAEYDRETGLLADYYPPH